MKIAGNGELWALKSSYSDRSDSRKQALKQAVAIVVRVVEAWGLPVRVVEAWGRQALKQAVAIVGRVVEALGLRMTLVVIV